MERKLFYGSRRRLPLVKGLSPPRFSGHDFESCSFQREAQTQRDRKRRWLSRRQTLDESWQVLFGALLVEIGGEERRRRSGNPRDSPFSRKEERSRSWARKTRTYVR